MKYILAIFFFCFSIFLVAQSSNSFSVYLIGDAGEDTVSGKALLMLEKELKNNLNSAVIFLGDNIYPSGLKKNDKKSELHLLSQLQILNGYKGQVYFIPGNHDWSSQKQKGLKVLANQEKYVNDYFEQKSTVANRNTSTFLPAHGLPGPETVMLDEKLRLIMIDTQWFLHLYKKNKIGSKKNTIQLFYFHLDSLLNIAKQNNEQVIVAAHHPLFTNGKHSRSLQPWRFLVNYTPFQIFGLMGLNRLYTQDLAQPRYKKMRNRIMQSLNKYDNIIYASGHEHNLQFFKQGAIRYIVSGAGSKLSHLRKNKKFDSIFQDDTKTGFVKLEFTSDKKINIVIYRVGEEPTALKYTN